MRTLISLILISSIFGCNDLKNDSKNINELKFEDSLNTAIFTTKFVSEDKNEITYVSHDLEDGAWQF
jgi:hypothetical protein